jgi:hypothetical protein
VVSRPLRVEDRRGYLTYFRSATLLGGGQGSGHTAGSPDNSQQCRCIAP